MGTLINFAISAFVVLGDILSFVGVLIAIYTKGPTFQNFFSISAITCTYTSK
jgi:hypothetical protein